MARCCAPVVGRSTRYRADGTTDTHCHRRGVLVIAGKWFCRQHYPLWREHYDIIERIRNIRPIRLDSETQPEVVRPK